MGTSEPNPGAKGFMAFNLRSVFDSARSIVMRTFMHLGFILAAIASNWALDDHFSFVQTIMVYVSLIHIFPKRPHPVASGTGLALAVTLGIMGAPLPALPVWAAGATWLVRMITRIGTSPFSWLSLPILGAMVIKVLSNPATKDIPAVWPFVLFLALGCGASFMLGRYLASRKRRLKFSVAIISLRRQAFELQGQPLGQALSDLSDQAEAYLAGSPSGFMNKLPGKDTALLTGLDRLADLVALSDGPPMSEIRTLAEQFREQNRPAKNVPEQTRTAKSVAYMKILMDLEKRRPSLPEAIRDKVGLICEQTRSIMDGMDQDPRDRSSGDRFLARYLEAAQKVTDGYLKLSISPPSEETARMLLKARDTLAALAEAFKSKRSRLFENDTLDIGVDLGVIEKLLKMEGFSNTQPKK